ncbi:MAG: GNAT family N-acetyltransferase [Thermaerobacter sp.]|nr:GNAT family N-acetyltransferase [Thermaerobacter sp.]
MGRAVLRPVDATNWLEVIQLQVAEDQRHFVASNLFSLAQAKIFDRYVPLAIYEAAVPQALVGFATYGPHLPSELPWIDRLMSDARFQRRGVGRAAMLALMERIQHERPGPMRISYEPDNQAAEALYASLGFMPTGEVLEGEIVREWRPPTP